MPRTPMVLELNKIATVWTPKVKLNNRVSIQITKEARLFLCHPLIIFQMHQPQTNPTLSTRNQARNLRLTKHPQELRNTDREILMEVPVVSLELAWRTQTKSHLKKVITQIFEHHIAHQVSYTSSLALKEI